MIEASVEQRTTKNTGCPYCVGQRAIPGETDVKTVDTDLIKEWDYEKNGELRPETLLPKSRVVVWWKCENGHSWQADIRSRFISKKRECPICKKKNKK